MSNWAPDSTRDLTPAPTVWPACSTCGLAYILRRVRVVDGHTWTWQTDCRHKSAPTPAGETP